MQAVSPRFLEAVRESHGTWAEVDLYPPGASEPGLENLVPIAGDVTRDRNAAIRGHASVTFAAAEVIEWPELATLAYGGEMVIRRGVRFGDDSVELVQLGVFRVQSVAQSFPGAGVALAGLDRMAQVQDERFTAPRTFPGQHAAAVIATLVREVYPGLPVHDSTTSDVTLADAVYERERIDAVTALARALAAEAFFDGAGELVLRPLPDLQGAPVAFVEPGEDGIMVGADRSLEREGAYNAVVATAKAGADQPDVTATAYDNDPASPTRWGGPFGHVPRFWQSPTEMTAAALADAAAGMLAEELGLRLVIDLDVVPNPALEPGDIVRVAYPGENLPPGYREGNIIDSVKLPLGPTGPMVLATRTVGEPPAVLAGRAL